MYCSHFGLQRLPFNNTPDPTFYYSTPDHEEALATLQYATQQRKGFVLVTGEIGAGKTLIGRIFLRQMDTNASIAAISQTNLTGRQLLAAICTEYNLAAPPEASSLELTQRLQDFLLEEFARDRVAVVLLDEAQNLPDESFEELRMLGNLEADDAKLLQVCILGQPELRERFRKPNMRQLDQRLFRRFHLSSLNAIQTADYIVHRLTIAGAAGRELFTPGAINRVYAASAGIPRLINAMCDNALLTAYGQDMRVVDERIIDLVLERDSSLRSAASFAEDELVPGEGLVDPLDSGRLAQLSLEHARELGAGIHALAGSREELQGELVRIAERQNELHKIVGGATTRWLAAKDKLEAYRKEIQTAIEEVNARCNATQEQLDELARNAAPSEDLDEIRQMHFRETERVLELVQSQREQLQRQLGEAETRVHEMHDRIVALTDQTLTPQGLQELNARHEQQARELFEKLDRQRREAAAGIEKLQKGCEQLTRQVEELAAVASRTHQQQATALEELSGRVDQQEQILHGLRQDLLGSFEQAQKRLAGLETDAVRNGQLERIRTEHAGEIAELIRRYNEHSIAVRKLKKVVVREIGGRASQQQAQAELATRVDGQMTDLEDLRRTMLASEVALQRKLAELEGRFASRSDMEELRRTQETRSEGILSRVDANRELIQKEIERILGQVEEQKSHLGEQVGFILSRCGQAEKRIEAVQSSVASNEAVANLRRQQAEDVESIRVSLQSQQREFEQLISRVHRRCEDLLGRFNSLPNPLPTAGEMQNLRLECAQQIQLLHAELLEGKQQADAVVRQLGERCDQALKAVEAVAAEKTDRKELAAMQREQDQKIADLRDGVAAQQTTLQTHIASVWSRCEQNEDRIEQLRGQTATAKDIQDLREQQEARLSGIIHRIESEKNVYLQELTELSERWEMARADLLGKIASAASEGTERVNRLREEHQHSVQELVRRLDDAHAEQRQEVNGLNLRWQQLTESLSTLSANSTPPARLQAVEEKLQDTLSHVQERVNALAVKQEDNLRTLVEKVLETSQRLDQLEATNQAPIQLHLGPEVRHQLTESIRSAQREREELNRVLEQAGAIAAHLHNSSSRVQEALQDWTSSAVEIREQSDQVRASARGASEVLAAMQRCHATIDSKLNSQRWRTELDRAEKLATRLEAATSTARDVCQQVLAALKDFDNCRSDTEGWQHRYKQARHVTEKLAKLLDQAGSVSAHLESRRHLLQAIARNTSGLAEVIEMARVVDEQRSMGSRREPVPPADHTVRPLGTRQGDTARRGTADDTLAAASHWRGFQGHQMAS